MTQQNPPSLCSEGPPPNSDSAETQLLKGNVEISTQHSVGTARSSARLENRSGFGQRAGRPSPKALMVKNRGETPAEVGGHGVSGLGRMVFREKQETLPDVLRQEASQVNKVTQGVLTAP